MMNVSDMNDSNQILSGCENREMVPKAAPMAAISILSLFCRRSKKL
jgi:hypothetical protein